MLQAAAPFTSIRMDDERLLLASGGEAAQQVPPAAEEVRELPVWLEDLRLFAVGWAGGLVFFGTLFA